MNNIRDILEKITEVMKECGGLILNADRSEAMVDEKAGHANFVTTYDKMVQVKLQKSFAEIFPEAVFVGEEEDIHASIEKGYAFNGYPNDNYKILRKSCTKLGIPVFSIHKCRHYFASALISENIDLASVAYNGGWKSFSMLEKRYGHAFKKKADAAMDVINKTVPVHEKSTDTRKGA